MIDVKEIDMCDYIGQCGTAIYAVTGAESELLAIAVDFEMAEDLVAALEYWKRRPKVKAVKKEVAKPAKARKAKVRKAIARSPAEIRADRDAAVRRIHDGK